MKKRVFGAVAVTAVLLLAGCSASEPAPSASTTENATTDEVTLYIVRHGRTMLNTTHRAQGWSDAVLTPEGEEVVKAAGRGLKDVDFQAAYSSDSGRAIQTAELILAESATSDDLALAHDSRLREFNFGTFEGELSHDVYTLLAERAGAGQSAEEYEATVTPQVLADSMAALDKENPDAAKNWPAEDYQQITARLKDAVDDIVDEEAARGDGNVLIVSHGLSISALFASLFPDYRIPEGGLKNASVSILKYKDGAFALESLNDLSYVEKGTR